MLHIHDRVELLKDVERLDRAGNQVVTPAGTFGTIVATNKGGASGPLYGINWDNHTSMLYAPQSQGEDYLQLITTAFHD
jgi:hypothetical protein